MEFHYASLLIMKYITEIKKHAGKMRH